MAPTGVLDLSVVTDRLIDMLEISYADSPWSPGPGHNEAFDIAISGSSPETVRNLPGDCQLSLYLVHTTEDKFHKNANWAPQAQRVAQTPPVQFQPLSLDLYYLLTAFANGNRHYVREQRAMSMAMRCFHDRPILKARRTPTLSTSMPEDLSLTMEIESIDQLGSMWQAFNVPYRMSAVYKASVTFIKPEEVVPAAAPKVESYNIIVGPASLPYSTATLVGTQRIVVYRPPPVPNTPDERRYVLSPATGAPGQQVRLLGGNLKESGFERIYLSSPTLGEKDITDWKVAEETESSITLQLPQNPGDPPFRTPQAGVYQLQMGSDPGGGRQPIRSNATPFSIAALVHPGLRPTIDPTGDTYTVRGVGFLHNRTEVLLGTVQLQKADGALTPGTFQINQEGDTIAFQRPVDLPAGQYAVRVRANKVDSDPAAWIIKEVP
jgi:hypothetical protein